MGSCAGKARRGEVWEGKSLFPVELLGEVCPCVLQKCGKVRWELWRLESLESGACSQLLGGRLPPLSSACKTLHPRQLGLAGTFHALKSQKGK